ncbi:hypothetical protein C1X30_21095 [Pseudomonas sp. FW305-BF6]|uniref:HEAT repeat domain-containing protein n=1 Tax=Pseudomonas syringae TaxID=317 RepID=A0A3T0JWT9_PSESX|nr:hypothetical protein [Pseudomonas sp. B707]AZV27772.1 hypothetical protein CT157_17735 [Pseudomonas syringae]MBX8469415.1 hypothetical protein [Pseudomonas sp. RIT778]PNA03394.1 hypothetical protein C1X28_20715 [Pseudomonas sp. FW305-BF15]PNB78904.1 hypothetical protein C1X30_21095 [Pseudomonas sp. FW305-BF6]TEA59505.1 hypothetical protein EIY71_22720 [Pseudomonas sp. CH235]
MSLFYQEPTVNHDEAVRILESGVERNVVAGLISIGLNESDRIWAQQTCLKYFASSNESVVASAITALGHIARRHGKLDKDIAFAALEEAKTRFPSLEGVIADTLDDIEAFT